MKKRTIFIIQGYDEEEADGRLKKVVVYELYATSAEEAIGKAKLYLEKNHYRVSSVIEK